jgi:hypothetical protein
MRIRTLTTGRRSCLWERRLHRIHDLSFTYIYLPRRRSYYVPARRTGPGNEAI